jgi:hypothetical protein
METTWVPYALSLALANVLALCALIPAWDRHVLARQAARRSTPFSRRPEAAAERIQDDPLESLVREVESAESVSRFGAPGEASLAEDIRRWRRRYADGESLPQAAADGRRAR